MKHEMTQRIVLITPEIAKRFLAVNFTDNHKNRPVKRHNVAYWKSVLVGGAITTTHQGIAIAGTVSDPIAMIDGQHRCIAIVETGIPARFWVAEYTPLEAFANIDNGMPRSMADRAGITGAEAQLANAFFYIGFPGGACKPCVRLIQEIHDIITPYASHVANSKKRALSITPIRAAFVVGQKKHGTNLSNEFQNGEFGVLTESLNALYRRQSTNPIGCGGGSNQQAAFCAAWRAISRPSNTKVYAPSSPREEARGIITQEFPEIVEIIASYGHSLKNATKD